MFWSPHKAGFDDLLRSVSVIDRVYYIVVKIAHRSRFFGLIIGGPPYNARTTLIYGFASDLPPDLFKLWWPKEPEDPEYVGCFHDDKADRVLAHRVTISGMTPAVCRDFCSDKDALFYATQVW